MSSASITGMKISTNSFSNYAEIIPYSSHDPLKYRRYNNKSTMIAYINSLEDNSITRLWFFGHAVPGQLWMALSHSDRADGTVLAHDPGPKLTFFNEDLKAIKKKKIYLVSKKTSHFIGCKTAVKPIHGADTDSSAETWHEHSSLRSRGFNETINFKNDDWLNEKTPPHPQTIHGAPWQR